MDPFAFIGNQGQAPPFQNQKLTMDRIPTIKSNWGLGRLPAMAGKRWGNNAIRLLLPVLQARCVCLGPGEWETTISGRETPVGVVSLGGTHKMADFLLVLISDKKQLGTLPNTYPCVGFMLFRGCLFGLVSRASKRAPIICEFRHNYLYSEGPVPGWATQRLSCKGLDSFVCCFSLVPRTHKS